MPKTIDLDDVIRGQKVELEMFFKYPDGDNNTIVINSHADQVRDELDKQFCMEILRKIHQLEGD